MNDQKNNERCQQVKSLPAAALEHSESGRKAFLDEACASDPSLRADVESLLSYEHTQGRAY